MNEFIRSSPCGSYFLFWDAAKENSFSFRLVRTTTAENEMLETVYTNETLSLTLFEWFETCRERSEDLEDNPRSVLT
jgi:hypothetical protein